jgi:hypothetical protein
MLRLIGVAFFLFVIKLIEAFSGMIYYAGFAGKNFTLGTN